MKHKPLHASILAIVCLLMLPLGAFAQLPSPSYGWNLGDTMEAPCVGCWSPLPTQALINGVANGGFNTIRIPCAWDIHANQSTHQIDTNYMAQVKQVVDWCYAKNLYIIVNDHWDDGWLENNIGTNVDPTINAKMNSYWTQIATNFVGYDNHLLFAGANEPNATNAAQMSTLTTYYNTFINAVRSTGGSNTSRWLVVQGPDTDIDMTYNLMNTMPTDPTPGRLMVEIHYYSPWNYCGLTSDQTWGNMFYFWGAAYHSTTLPSRNSSWGEESNLDAEFQKMTDKFTSHGIPVMIGEFQAMKRTTADYPDLTGANVNLHLAGRTYFDWYVVDSARRHGLHPFYWDTPGGAQLFDWTAGTVSDPDGVRALTGGAALPPTGSTIPTISLGSGTNPSTYGNPVTFTATVKTNSVTLTNIAGETITFYNGSTQLGTGFLKGNGSATLITTNTQLGAGTWSITGVYGGDATYSASTNSPALSQVVNQATLTAGLTGTVSKNYDGTTVATLVAGNYTLPGVLSGDMVTLNNPTGGTYDTRNRGPGKTVTVTGLSISGASVANYVLSSSSASAAIGTINASNITVTAAADSKFYDGMTLSATLPAITSGSVQPGDTAGFTQSYTDPAVGAGKTLTPSGIVNDGNGGANYVYTFVSSTNGMIKPLVVSVLSGVTANNKLYDGATAATISLTNVMLGGVLGADVGNVSLFTNGYAAVFASPNVGIDVPVTVGGLSLMGSAASNYTLTQPTGLNADIMALVTVTGITVQSGTAQVTFIGQSGQDYRVLASSDLTLPVDQWTVLTNGTLGTGPVTFTESLPPQTQSRYYRIAAP